MKNINNYLLFYEDMEDFEITFPFINRTVPLGLTSKICLCRTKTKTKDFEN